MNKDKASSEQTIDSANGLDEWIVHLKRKGNCKIYDHVIELMDNFHREVRIEVLSKKLSDTEILLVSEKIRSAITAYEYDNPRSTDIFQLCLTLRPNSIQSVGIWSRF